MDFPVPVLRDTLRAALAEAAAATEMALYAANLAGRCLASVDSARAAVISYAVFDTVIVASQTGSIPWCATGRANLPESLTKVRMARAATEKALMDAEAAHAPLVVASMEAISKPNKRSRERSRQSSTS